MNLKKIGASEFWLSFLFVACWEFSCLCVCAGVGYNKCESPWPLTRKKKKKHVILLSNGGGNFARFDTLPFVVWRSSRLLLPAESSLSAPASIGRRTDSADTTTHQLCSVVVIDGIVGNGFGRFPSRRPYAMTPRLCRRVSFFFFWAIIFFNYLYCAHFVFRFGSHARRCCVSYVLFDRE